MNGFGWLMHHARHTLPGRGLRLKRWTNIALGIGSGTSFCLMLSPATTVPTSGQDDIVTSVVGFTRFFRSIQIGMVISTDYYFSMMGLTRGQPNYDVMMSRIHQRAANRILQGCLNNGGSYIKLGQGLVSMSHILPREYIKTLQILQDKCLAREKGEIVELFVEDFGKYPEEIFKTFEGPIAAASLAQVYKATTFNDELVAVKVQYKDLQKRFQSDVLTIKILLKLIGLMHPNYDFSWIINDVVETMRDELDFVNEGKNAERCATDLARFNYIKVPKIYWQYTSTRVLVMEFVDGIKINNVDELKAKGFTLRDIDNKMFEAFGYQIFQTGFVHADPHPGNVMVNSDGQLAILDHGLYQKVADRDRIALSQMWKAIVFNNHIEMEKFSNILGVEDYQLFAEILTQSPLKSLQFKLKSKLSEEDLQHITEAARLRFDQIMKCLQEMPRPLLLVIRNLNTIRAIAHDHGNPVDRYTVLWRCATENTFKTRGIFETISTLPKRLYFEFKLIIFQTQKWFHSTVINLLIYFRIIPDVKTIMPKFV